MFVFHQEEETMNFNNKNNQYHIQITYGRMVAIVCLFTPLPYIIAVWLQFKKQKSSQSRIPTVSKPDTTTTGSIPAYHRLCGVQLCKSRIPHSRYINQFYSNFLARRKGSQNSEVSELENICNKSNSFILLQPLGSQSVKNGYHLVKLVSNYLKAHSL